MSDLVEDLYKAFEPLFKHPAGGHDDKSHGNWVRAYRPGKTLDPYAADPDRDKRIRRDRAGRRAQSGMRRARAAKKKRWIRDLLDARDRKRERDRR